MTDILLSLAVLVLTTAGMRWLVGPGDFDQFVKWLWPKIEHRAWMFYRRGWRPMIPWVFIYFIIGMAYRMVHGLPLVDLPSLVTAAVPLTAGAGGMIWSRCVETLQGKANDRPAPVVLNPFPEGGLVNNAAIA